MAGRGDDVVDGGAVNEDTLVAVHCYAGDKHLVEAFLPQYQHHGYPVVVLSPADAPVAIEGIECRSAGGRGYFGQVSLDRQREHLKLLLSYPQKYFLLNDADSFCLSPQIPDYLYENAEGTIWSNEVREGRPHPSPYPKIALHPPYFLTRETIERLLAVGPVEAHPITPFIDWMMLALACEAGVAHRPFPDGRSFPAWRHGSIPETTLLGHDFVHHQEPRGIDGAARMVSLVQRAGVVFVHSVKHPEVRDQLVTAFRRRRERKVRVPQAPAPYKAGGTSVLVAFRDDSPDQHRTKLWEAIQQLYRRHLPELEIMVASDDGEDPFHKTLALNRAAERANGNLLLIADADTWAPSNQIREAIGAIRSGTTWWRPWNLKLKFGPADTDAVLADETWDGAVPPEAMRRLENRNTYWAAPPLLVTREQFDRVRGFDERMRGWGQEDEAFALSLRSLVGQSEYIKGHAVHLWHPRIGRSGSDLWPGQTDSRANLKLARQYRTDALKPERMQQLVNQR